MRIVAPAGEKRSALSIRMRATRATAPGSPEAHTGPVGGTTASSTPRSRARSPNSAATARHISPISTGSRRRPTRAAHLTDLDRLAAQLDAGVQTRQVQQLGGQVGQPAQLVLTAAQDGAGVL